MTTWILRLHEQPTLRLELEDTRNLAEEFAGVRAAAKRDRWWRRTDPYWHITENVIVHRDIIVGVSPKIDKVRPRIGFAPEET